MNTTILEYWNNAFNYYLGIDSFDSFSDADAVTANYICEFKNWNFERALNFITNLRTR